MNREQIPRIFHDAKVQALVPFRIELQLIVFAELSLSKDFKGLNGGRDRD